MMNIGASRVIFLSSPDNSLTETTTNAKKLTCFQLGLVHRQKSPFLTNHIALSFTEKEYSVTHSQDSRFAPPAAYQTSPIYNSQMTTYREKNASISFSLNYMNNRSVSPIIGVGVELGNAFTMTAHYTKSGTYFDRDSSGNMINQHRVTTVDQYWKSSYYLNSLTAMFNLGVIFRIDTTWNLGLIYSYKGTLNLGGPTTSTPYVGVNHQLFGGIYYYLPSKKNRMQGPNELNTSHRPWEIPKGKWSYYQEWKKNNIQGA